jgi:sporulation protein YlmC with PRC-barrel domain
MAKAESSRGLRDEANVGPDPRRTRELRPLKDMKWKVADGEPDIRGWSVFASTGRELGVVHELLVDVEAQEVVMLDVDLKRDDRHTIAPLRAAWIDRSAKRVVIDAHELAANESLPALPRAGALTDADMTQFSDGYERAYGRRGYEADQQYRLRRGDEELRFGAAPLVDRRAPSDAPTAAPIAAPIAAPTAATPPRADDAPRRLLTNEQKPYFDESRAINRELADLPRERAAQDDRRAGEVEAIEPRELDARVRIEEGGIVDEDTPVGSVRYPDENHPEHSYGTLDDAERAERVVSRHPHTDAGEAATRLSDTADGRVRYRSFADDTGRPDDIRP